MKDPLIGIVGPCGAGKSTLEKRLSMFFSNVHAIAQEHSYVPSMWQRINDPDILIYLDVSYPMTINRRSLRWTEAEYQIEQERLSHARRNADIYIVTDELTPDEITQIILQKLKDILSSRKTP
ncbi:MAG: hypothetical protein JW704_08165 [Anaerolineaceae bacterium]|nr:hypothetical protein [Anaerolineaceae bacterium]